MKKPFIIGTISALLLLSVYFFEPYFWGLLSLYGIIVLTKLGFQFLYSSANYKLIRQKHFARLYKFFKEQRILCS